MKIGNFDLQTDGTFITAELSANHNGSLQTALKTIKTAHECGANAIKLQTYTADTLTLNCDKEDFIIKGGTLWDNKTFYDLYKEAYTPWEWHKELFDYARNLGIEVKNFYILKFFCCTREYGSILSPTQKQRYFLLWCQSVCQ